LELSVRALRGSDGEKAHGLLRGRAYRYAFATLLCAVALVPPAAAAARDLVVYGEPTLQAALKSIAGANLADISRLIAGKRLAIANPDRDPAGARAVGLLRKIGVAVDDNKAVAVAESSAGVVNLLATEKARLGIVYSTDVTAGFKLVVPLPLLDQPPIEYVVAQARDPQSDTRPFMTFVKSAAAKAAFKAAGLAPIDDAQAAGGIGD
jgi:molybdenum ABC transporter molybdate-binding protein